MIRRYVKAQTLFELLVSLALSAFLLLVILEFYSYVRWQNRMLFQQLQLQMEMQKVIQLMSKDLRRSGFRAVNENISENNLFLFEQEGKYKDIVLRNQCILFFYDLNADGCIGVKKSGSCIEQRNNTSKMIETELFGYRLHKKMIETRSTYKNSVKQSCDKAECQSYIGEEICTKSVGWIDLLDSSEYEILNLEFNFEGEKAIFIRLKGRLKQSPHIEYETSTLVPLMNEM